MEYNEENFLLLSGIQHFAFCRRQWALIHIEQQWDENLRTVEGRIMHENAHDGYSSEKRGNVLISRGMAIHSRALGISGVCDVVEFRRDDEKGINIFGREGKYIVVPVEYKRGKPKENDIDVLQLVAQACCLEEMLECVVEEGFLFYGETRHRLRIAITNELRDKVKEVFAEMHSLYERRYTPKVKRTKSCNACSLKDLCLPVLNKNRSVSAYIESKTDED